MIKIPFSNNPKHIYWSSKNKLKPEDVSMNSHKNYWFNCEKCNHEFESSPHSISGMNSWCSYCGNKKLCKCNTCFKKSFESHPKSNCWSFKNKLQTYEIFKNSHKRYLFNCE